ncbi:hypothetical protein ACPV4B_00975 [Vibrio parahaemolyticus]|uniref:hypothetical protein n=1 Tax=Vibrio mediterranei TaxID=689 RepID=UPI00406773CE
MKVTNIILLIVMSLSLPVLALDIILGLSGDTAHYYWIVFVGYLLVILTSIWSFFWGNVRYVPLFGVLLMITGYVLDYQFWKQHNLALCLELRANPSCLEDDIGFSCTDFYGSGFSTSNIICKDAAQNQNISFGEN